MSILSFLTTFYDIWKIPVFHSLNKQFFDIETTKRVVSLSPNLWYHLGVLTRFQHEIRIAIKFYWF